MLGGFAIGNTQTSPSDVVFALCPSHIEKIMFHHDDGWVTTDIKLTDSASKTFANLTERYEGQILSIVAGDQLLARATVQGGVRTGRVRIDRITSNEAEKLEEVLNEKESTVECGVTRGY